MPPSTLIKKIEAKQPLLGLTILRNERFKLHPFKATWFYLIVALNRYAGLRLPIKAKTIWGDYLTAYETSAAGSVYFLGFYDTDVTLFLLKNFREKGDLLDVGSNVGYYTSLFTQIAIDNAQVVAFEPTPSTCAVLIKNVSGLKNVKIEQIALSNKTGTSNFFDYGIRHGVFNSTAAQPISFLKNKGSEIKVQTDTLDNWCRNNNVKPSLIKLDTEGTEHLILSEGKMVLKTSAPVILLEVGGGDAWKDNIKTSMDILTENNYQFFELSELGELIKHVRQDSYTYKNLVCIPERKLSQYVSKS